MNELLDYIMVTPQLISDINLEKLQTFCKTDTRWKESETTGKLKDYRTCSSLEVTKILRDDYHGVQKPEDLEWIDKTFFEAAGEAARYYMKKFPDLKVKTDTGVVLLKYPKGCYYKEHVDHHQTMPRSISLSFSINDDYTGGMFSFFGGTHNRLATAGKAIVFPSNFMFPHGILPITSGTRYSCVMWFI
ncbi:MAG TPA: 2OG-Fe(II) oxygenase [Methylomirabilota bacterium]|nr:2OG-Fe(II) oxygenase [Methylomirabilota bacterium]